MKQIHKISAIGLLAVVIGIITVGPAMADKDSSEGHNKIDICHFDKENGKYVKLSIPENKAKGHEKNHVNDMPAPPEGCPEEDSEIGFTSDDGVNMDDFMEDLTRHDEVITEITNSECSLGEVVTGFGPNGELLCSPDNTGDYIPVNIITRTDVQTLENGDDLFKLYFCESGEIMLGGLIVVPPMTIQSIINGVLVNNSEQSYVATVSRNNNQEAVTVEVTYSCLVI